jgi:hypothetical protein
VHPTVLHELKKNSANTSAFSWSVLAMSLVVHLTM